MPGTSYGDDSAVPYATPPLERKSKSGVYGKVPRWGGLERWSGGNDLRGPGDLSPGPGGHPDGKQSFKKVPSLRRGGGPRGGEGGTVFAVPKRPGRCCQRACWSSVPRVVACRTFNLGKQRLLSRMVWSRSKGKTGNPSGRGFLVDIADEQSTVRGKAPAVAGNQAALSKEIARSTRAQVGETSGSSAPGSASRRAKNLRFSLKGGSGEWAPRHFFLP